MELQDFYNFMLDSPAKGSSAARSIGMQRNVFLDNLIGSKGVNGDLDSLMNGPIKKKLKIIPNNLT